MPSTTTARRLGLRLRGRIINEGLASRDASGALDADLKIVAGSPAKPRRRLEMIFKSMRDEFPSCMSLQIAWIACNSEAWCPGIMALTYYRRINARCFGCDISVN